MVACICCGTVEAGIVLMVAVPSLMAVAADAYRKIKQPEDNENASKSETAAVPA